MWHSTAFVFILLGQAIMSMCQLQPQPANLLPNKTYTDYAAKLDWLFSFRLQEKHGITHRHRSEHIKHSFGHKSCYEYANSDMFEMTCTDSHSGKRVIVDCSTLTTENPRVIWYRRCLASQLVKQGFQVPVYIVHTKGYDIRKERITRHMAEVGILPEHVTWITSYPANNISEADHARFINVPRSPAGALAEYCFKVIPAWLCNRGLTFSNVQKSCFLKHADIMQQISARPANYSAFYLVLEDDQFLPHNFMTQMLEVMLSEPDVNRIFMLDDSFFFDYHFDPPRTLINDVFPIPFNAGRTRTSGAYIVTHRSATGIYPNLFPAIGPIDHQLAYAALSNGTKFDWMTPTITCSGSQGLEDFEAKLLNRTMPGGSSTGGGAVDAGDRQGCNFCCDRYYNMATLEAYFDIFPIRKL